MKAENLNKKIREKINSLVKTGKSIKFAPEKWLRLGKEKIENEPLYSGVLVCTVAIAGIGIIYCMDDYYSENTAGGTRIVSENHKSEVRNQRNRLDIKGMEEASASTNLRNPFGPNRIIDSPAKEKSYPKLIMLLAKGISSWYQQLHRLRLKQQARQYKLNSQIYACRGLWKWMVVWGLC